MTNAHTSAPITHNVTIINTFNTLSKAVLYRYDDINMYENNEYTEFKSDLYIEPNIDIVNNSNRNT